jgi:Fur family ferric uptake transcriptional regulator/Fur family peroxide stress response transcriptional regulator
MSAVEEPKSTQVADQRDLIELLHSRGQRVTSQRLVILRELRRRAQHATAEELHRAVQQELPGISVPTIYATLELFVDLGLARRIETGTAAMYDAGLEPHQHAVCRRCGRVQDVNGRLNANALLGAARAAGFHPYGAELIISGLCAECASGVATSTA